jgi:transposase
MRKIISQETQRAIRRDYAERTEDGFRYSVSEVATRNGVSVHYVCKLVKRWGLRRYCIRGVA